MIKQIKPIDTKLSAAIQRQLDIADWAKNERLRVSHVSASLLGATDNMVSMCKRT